MEKEQDKYFKPIKNESEENQIKIKELEKENESIRENSYSLESQINAQAHAFGIEKDSLQKRIYTLEEENKKLSQAVERLTKKTPRIKENIKREVVSHLKNSKKVWDSRKDEDCFVSVKKVILSNINSYGIALDTIEKLESEA